MSNINIRQLKEKCYSQEKKATDRLVSLWLFYFTRPASFPLTYLALKLKISPNMATLIGFLIGLAAIIESTRGNFLISALLLNLFGIFDCVDGNLARLSKSSNKGEFYDAIAGDIVNYLYPIVFLFSALEENKFNLINFFDYRLFQFLIVSIVLIQLLSALASLRLKLLSGPNKSQNLPIKKASLLEIMARNLYGAAFLYPAILVTCLFNLFDALFLFLVFMSPVFYCVSIYRIRSYES